MRRFLVIGLVTLLSGSLAVQIAYSQSSNNIPVQVSIHMDTAQPEIITQRVRSYVYRELRSLGDVDVVNEGGRIILKIGGMEAINRREDSIGYIISVISLFPDTQSAGAFYFDDTLLATGRDGLRSTSEAIVAWFDQSTIEVVRQLRQAAGDAR